MGSRARAALRSRRERERTALQAECDEITTQMRVEGLDPKAAEALIDRRQSVLAKLDVLGGARADASYVSETRAVVYEDDPQRHVGFEADRVVGHNERRTIAHIRLEDSRRGARAVERAASAPIEIRISRRRNAA